MFTLQIILFHILTLVMQLFTLGEPHLNLYLALFKIELEWHSRAAILPDPGLELINLFFVQ